MALCINSLTGLLKFNNLLTLAYAQSVLFNTFVDQFLSSIITFLKFKETKVILTSFKNKQVIKWPKKIYDYC